MKIVSSTYTSGKSQAPLVGAYEILSPYISESRRTTIHPNTARANLIKEGAKPHRLKPEHIKVYSNAFSLYDNPKSYLWHYINEASSKVINAGANGEKLEVFLDLAIHEAKRHRWGGVHSFVYSLTTYFTQLLKSKPNSKEWELFKDFVDYSKKRNISKVSLPGCFAHIVEAKLTDFEWEIFKGTIETCKKRKYNLNNILVEFSKLAELKLPETILSFYFQMIDYCTKEKLSIAAPRYPFDAQSLTGSFYKFLEKKPSDKLWNTYVDLVSHFKKEKWDLKDLTRVFCYLASSKISKEKLNKLINLIEFHKGIKKDKGERPDTEHMMTSFIENYLKLIGAKQRINRGNPSKDEWELYNDVAEYYVKNNWSMEGVTRHLAEFIEREPSPEIWETCKEIVKYLKSDNRSLTGLFDIFSDLAIEAITNKYLELFKKCFLSLKEFDYETKKLIAQCCIHLNNLKAPQGVLNNLYTALQEGKIKTNEELTKLLSEITVHAAISNIIRDGSDEARNNSRRIINYVATNDTLPYPLETSSGKVHPKAKKVYNETLQVYRRGFDVHHGFSSLTFETKRPPTKEHSLLARFGKDVAQSIKYLNAKDINLFPGRGFLISGIMPERIFVQDKEALKRDDDPYHKYKTAWPWGKDEFNDLEKTHFIFTRGFIAISCTRNSNYELPDIDGKKVHYSYIVFNDHHHNDGSKVAFLIPTEILKNKIQGTTISYDDYVGPQKDKKDINEAGLTLEDIVKEAKAIPANVLNIGWGSNIGGSLCNAYEVASKPLYEWEGLPKFKDETRDIYGHVHKSHRNGIYESEMTKSLSRKLKPLREAHDYIFALTTKYQNLLDLFRLSLSLWHKGQTLGERLEIDEISDDDLFSRTGLEFEEELLAGDVVDFANNPSSTRMLAEAYKWHKPKETEENNINNFPLLACAETLDYWNKPDTPFTLDTYDMSLKIEDTKYQLPEDSNGAGDEEAKIWYSKVIPYIIPASKDMRFYDRRDLGY